MTTVNRQKVQFRLHPKQLEIYHSHARFKIAQCGRRFGKTRLAWVICLLFMLQNPNCLLWWVAPIYKELAAATRTVREVTPKAWISKKLESCETIRYLRLFNDSECFFHSADREDSLRGSGLHGLVIDEAPILKKIGNNILTNSRSLYVHNCVETMTPDQKIIKTSDFSDVFDLSQGIFPINEIKRQSAQLVNQFQKLCFQADSLQKYFSTSPERTF